MFAIAILVLAAICTVLLAVACYRLGDVSHALFALRVELSERLDAQGKAIDVATSRAQGAIDAATHADETSAMTYGIVAKWAVGRPPRLGAEDSGRWKPIGGE